ncbi:MAG TPA: protein phosphatase 2C domain-containing protein, partial [Burkholderiales bacterium]|nr:protein phosphatase 2C domain-containing protein [Burkholderiales bacterium]
MNSREEELRVAVSQSSLTGKRTRNEDFVGTCTPEGSILAVKGMLFAVADGVGGHAKGREAAEYAVRGLAADYYATPETWSVEKSLDTVLKAGNRWLLSHARRSREYAGMATTLTVLVICGSRFHVGHVGDSRAYLWRNGRISQLTEDHTWDHPELHNVLRRAIGLDDYLVVDHLNGDLEPSDRFVLVTDGVWGSLGSEGIGQLLSVREEAAERLAMAAVQKGSGDNCTALVIDILSVPERNFRDSLAMARQLPLPPRLKPGQSLDGMTVVALLHESRSVLVYRVERRFQGAEEHLVLKTLPPELGDDEESIAALVYEEWLTRRVVGPCFPEVATNPGRSCLYFLTFWHEGETLKRRMERGHRFDPEEVVRIGSRLMKGISILHRLGILHRDIKPDNLHLYPMGQ